MITTVIKKIVFNLTKETPIFPIAIFRMAFGFLMAFSMVRFMYNGWIEDCYLNTNFHFTYRYFSWVTAFDATTMYAIVSVCAIAALCIGLGLFYKVATILFFTTFTYLELIEKAWYLNHYYFVSLVAFLLILVPANRIYSLDSKFNNSLKLDRVPVWTILIFKLQLCVVYFFGGIAKLQSDWLFKAQPLKIWLKTRTDIPLLGRLFEYDITPYLFSWSGMLYDLAIPFLLWTKKTRPIAYILVLVFHILTHVLFDIGMFPWLMIFGSLIFITDTEWRRIFLLINYKIPIGKEKNNYRTRFFIIPILIIYFVFQALIPIRHFFLTDNVLWSENGFRFAWHVMVMEKNGYSEFTVVDNTSKKVWKEYPSKRLKPIQEYQMNFQPDMIWQYAQFLKNIYKQKGYTNISIYVASKVSLNGRLSKPYINNKIDVLQVKSMDDVYKYVLKLK